jgi:hypothetical protein
MGDLARCEMSKTEAEKLCDKIRSGIEGVAELVLKLHDDQGWIALGYATWRQCCEKEFGHSASWAGRQIRAAKVREAVPIGTDLQQPQLTESQARELAKVPADKQKAVLAWAEEATDGHVTAASIRKAASDMTEQEPDDEPEEDADEPESVTVDCESEEEPAEDESKTDELAVWIDRFMSKYPTPRCVMAAMLENLAAKLRSE